MRGRARPDHRCNDNALLPLGAARPHDGPSIGQTPRHRYRRRRACRRHSIFALLPERLLLAGAPHNNIAAYVARSDLHGAWGSRIRNSYGYSHNDRIDAPQLFRDSDRRGNDVRVLRLATPIHNPHRISLFPSDGLRLSGRWIGLRHHRSSTLRRRHRSFVRRNARRRASLRDAKP